MEGGSRGLFMRYNFNYDNCRNNKQGDGIMKEIIRMIKAMNDNESNNVFAREIALLCEENDKLRAELREVKMMIENNNNKKIKNN